MTGIHKSALIGSLLLATVLAACAGEPQPRFTPQDVQRAEQTGSLESLYEEVAGELRTLDPGSEDAAETRVLLETIGAKLTDQMAERVKAELRENLLPWDRYPLDVLDREIARIAAVEDWDAVRYAKASSVLQAERRRTIDEIRATERELATLGDDRLDARLQLLGHLTDLLGPGSAAYAGYAAERAKILDRLRREAEQAVEPEENEQGDSGLARRAHRRALPAHNAPARPGVRPRRGLGPTPRPRA